MKNVRRSQDTAINDKKVLIIYTGGTIGMVETEDGYAPKENEFLHTLKGIAELSDRTMPKWDIIEFSPLLDSTNVAVGEWNKIGRIIYEKYQNYDGFVVLHGTDTMAYSASALSFILKNLSKPVVFTGSQIPLCKIRSDAKDNIITSLIIAASGEVNEVCLYFGGKLFRGNRSVKTSADRFTAFNSPSFPPLATAGITIDYNKVAEVPKTNGELQFTELKQKNIGVIKVFPGINFGLFQKIATKELDGLVIETFGTGNIPDYDDSVLPLIEKARKNGTVITVCSQCVSGTVSLGQYKTSASLKQIGVISGGDMTTEAAIAKLYYLLTKGCSADDIKKYMETNLCGELTEK